MQYQGESDVFGQLVNRCMELDEKKRPNVIEVINSNEFKKKYLKLIAYVSPQIMSYLDEKKEIETALNNQIFNLSKKM